MKAYGVNFVCIPQWLIEALFNDRVDSLNLALRGKGLLSIQCLLDNLVI